LVSDQKTDLPRIHELLTQYADLELDFVDASVTALSFKRSGLAEKKRTRSESSRSIVKLSGKNWWTKVDSPVPRGPNKKKLPSEGLKNRLINSIFGPKMEKVVPKYQVIFLTAREKLGSIHNS
jgi:hypothetical protein